MLIPLGSIRTSQSVRYVEHGMMTGMGVFVPVRVLTDKSS